MPTGRVRRVPGSIAVEVVEYVAADFADGQRSCLGRQHDVVAIAANETDAKDDVTELDKTPLGQTNEGSGNGSEPSLSMMVNCCPMSGVKALCTETIMARQDHGSLHL